MHPPGVLDPTSALAPADAVLRFLESVGRRSELEFYVALFRKDPREQFALIVVDDAVAREASEAVVLHLRFLHHLGLVPVVLFCAPRQRTALAHARRVERALIGSGATAASLPARDAEASRVAELCRDRTVPLLATSTAPSGRRVAARPPHSELASAAVLESVTRLVLRLGTRKLLFLHGPGGILHGGALLPIVNLTADAASLQVSPALTSADREIVASVQRVVEAVAPRRILVSVTSPLNLLRELFTTKGAGTLFRVGAVITRATGYDTLDLGRLTALLTSAFGRPPSPSFFARPMAEVHLADGYRGAAIVVQTPLGTYLSKFAVDPEAQGEGIARDLWGAFASAHPRLFWRARAQNPIVEWYTKLCDGFMRVDPWIVFWRGVEPAEVPALVEYARAQPVDILP